jgi:hypothetical protein
LITGQARSVQARQLLELGDLELSAGTIELTPLVGRIQLSGDESFEV